MFDTAWTDTYTLHIHCNNLPTHTRIQSIFILYAYIYIHIDTVSTVASHNFAAQQHTCNVIDAHLGQFLDLPWRKL